MSMKAKMLPLVVLVASLTALVVSVGWAVALADNSNGNEMMRRYGSGMMGYSPSSASEPVRDLAGAKQQAQKFADRLGLRAGEVMRFTNNYYVELSDRNGKLATEVLVEPSNGAVYLEYGPAMMWNTRYGMMSDFRMRGTSGMMGGGMMGNAGDGMMGGSNGGMMGDATGGMMGGANNAMMGRLDPTWTPGTTTAAVTPEKAQRLAQGWLRRQGSGLSAGKPDPFPGYYTVHVLRDGKILGMVSVNASTGAVWSHWWHGRFISMLEG